MKLIVTSATMDAQKFADFFGNVPTFQVSVVLFFLCLIARCPAKPKLPILLVSERNSTCCRQNFDLWERPRTVFDSYHLIKNDG